MIKKHCSMAWLMYVRSFIILPFCADLFWLLGILKFWFASLQLQSLIYCNLAGFICKGFFTKASHSVKRQTCIRFSRWIIPVNHLHLMCFTGSVDCFIWLIKLLTFQARQYLYISLFLSIRCIKVIFGTFIDICLIIIDDLCQCSDVILSVNDDVEHFIY